MNGRYTETESNGMFWVTSCSMDLKIIPYTLLVLLLILFL